MSRLGKKPIPIPEKTEVSVAGSAVSVKGPGGTLVREFSPRVSITVADKAVSVALREGGSEGKAHVGTSVAHLKNMMAGVNQPFSKKLIVEGIGFKSEVKGGELVLSVGFTHPVALAIPKALAVTAEKNVITVSGADIEAVGGFAALVRAAKAPEPYKGKGIRYADEVIRRKEGKKTV